MVLTVLKEGSKIITVAFYKTIINIFNDNKMTSDEAMKILDVKNLHDKNLIYAKYKDLLNRNEKKSKYLQQKIQNAFTFLKKYP